MCMGKSFRYSPGIRVYGLMKTMEPQDTTCTGRVTCTSEVGRAAPIRENKNAHRIVVEKNEGKKPPGMSRCKWGDNIKIYLNPLKAELNPICCLLALLGAHHFLRVSRIRVKEIKWVGVNWIHLAQNRDKWRVFVNT